MFEFVTAVVSDASLSDWLLLSLGLLVLFYIAGTWNYDYFEKLGVPAKKPKIPFIGTTLGFFVGSTSFVDAVKEQYEMCREHGIYGTFLFTEPGFVITDPELLKVVAVKEFDSFMNHRTTEVEKTDPIFNKNLFNIKDQQWRDMRATLSPAFTTSKIKGMFPLISQCGSQLAQHLREKYAHSEEGKTSEPLAIEMRDLFARIANDVIATAAFGINCDSLKNPDNEFYRMGNTLTTFTKFRTFLFLCTLVFPKLLQALGLAVLDVKATKFFDSLVHETIRERQQKGIFRPDMLQLLMEAQKGELTEAKEDANEAQDVGTKKKLTNDEISGQAMIFFFGGFDTVSIALCLATHILSHQQEEQKRLQAEIDEVMEQTGGQPTYEAVQSMKYLDAVVSECLRMYPPAIVTDRMCQKDTVLPPIGNIGSVLVRKGQGISIPIVGMHYEPKYWEEPEKFNPDRFSDENKHKIKPYTYMPFGLGPRICIAQRFALVEVKVILLHLLANLNLHPCAKTKRPLEFDSGFNLMVRGGYWCEVTPREVQERG